MIKEEVDVEVEVEVELGECVLDSKSLILRIHLKTHKHLTARIQLQQPATFCSILSSISSFLPNGWKVCTLKLLLTPIKTTWISLLNFR